MSVLRKIVANLDRMSPADREIGRFIADNPERMLELSSAALAAEIGRSQSSVVKFAQRLGYGSYQDLKLAVSSVRAQGWRLPAGPIHGSIEQGDGLATVFEKLISSKYRAMRETVASNGARGMERAVEAIDTARRIYLMGVGASALVASDFSYKLLKLGRVVIQNSDAHIQMANIAGIRAEDVLVAISYSGSSVETVKVAEAARSRGAKLIALTGMQDNALSRLADILLHTVADEDNVRASSITARDAQLALTDLLFLMIVQTQPDAQTYIHDSETAVKALKAQ
jgi:DNA-binding MurR/RpiR family transcriptional regulator